MKNFKLLAVLLMFSTGAAFAKDYTPAELVDYAENNYMYGISTDLSSSLHKLKLNIGPKSINQAKDAVDSALKFLEFRMARSFVEGQQAQKRVSEFCSDSHIILWMKERMKLCAIEDLNDSDRISVQEKTYQKCSNSLTTVKLAEEDLYACRTKKQTLRLIRDELHKLSQKYNS